MSPDEIADQYFRNKFRVDPPQAVAMVRRLLGDPSFEMSPVNAWQYHCLTASIIRTIPPDQLITGVSIAEEDQRHVWKQEAYRSICSIFKRGSVVLWTPQSMELAIADEEKFLDIPLGEEDIPESPEHWIFPFCMEGPDRKIPSVFLIPSRVTSPPHQGIYLTVFATYFTCKDSPMWQHLIEFLGHTKIGEPMGTNGNDAIQSMLFWKRQRRVVSTSAANLPRAERRRLKRQGITPEHGRSVQVVLLRKDDKVPVRKPGEKRDWQHRWLVRHHLRLITDKKTQQKRPVYVRDHLKGPEDKPFLPPKPVVQKVVR